MLIFLYIESNLLGYGLGASPNEGGGNVRDLLALTWLHRLGALRGSQGLAEG